MEQPVSAASSADRWAIALGNASLLGIGYLLAGRRTAAVGPGFVTALLVVFLAGAARSVWAEVAVLLWWVTVVTHGWLLAARRPAPSARVWRQRIIALAAAIPVLAAVVLLRVDAARVGTQLARAREAGDCAAVAAGADRVHAGHRLADAPLTDTVDRSVRACADLWPPPQFYVSSSDADVRAAFEPLLNPR
ncbi:hypothetical protein [Nocardia wallacei]|uniref:hypothetical protein n=1 Tax=Nocardia wallacei TaxID=480035 RepID=UPI0024571454|nr:hypothetical protein [Nocardia wallacei]